jgi:hypothetical protein
VIMNQSIEDDEGKETKSHQQILKDELTDE